MYWSAFSKLLSWPWSGNVHEGTWTMVNEYKGCKSDLHKIRTALQHRYRYELSESELRERLMALTDKLKEEVKEEGNEELRKCAKGRLTDGVAATSSVEDESELVDCNANEQQHYGHAVDYALLVTQSTKKSGVIDCMTTVLFEKAMRRIPGEMTFKKVLWSSLPQSVQKLF